MSSEPTVHVVDNDAEVCQSLRGLIESAGFHVATYASAKEFLNCYAPETPGCLVLDLRLPGYSGLNLQPQFVSDGIDLPVIINTGHDPAPPAVQTTRTQAIDFIGKPFANQPLVDRVRRAVEWDIRNRVERARRAEIVARLALLTPRERDVLDRVVNGGSNKRIARELGISTKTVEAHRAHVMEKMSAKSLAGLVQLVQAAGLKE